MTLYRYIIVQNMRLIRLFSTDDAIVVYFATRILGVNILQKLGRVESYKVYDIL